MFHFNFASLFAVLIPTLTSTALAAGTAALSKGAVYLHHKTKGIKQANLRNLADSGIDALDAAAVAAAPAAVAKLTSGVQRKLGPAKPITFLGNPIGPIGQVGQIGPIEEDLLGSVKPIVMDPGPVGGGPKAA